MNYVSNCLFIKTNLAAKEQKEIHSSAFEFS